ncbi:MAG: hypothetical protein BWY65_02371 [Firmicutes bacterium ADurb.Bin373]|nr:MAG: hypothetical protein BWY65_02371 [Firmicutes bacterium ADurb.Bin373]
MAPGFINPAEYLFKNDFIQILLPSHYRRRNQPGKDEGKKKYDARMEENCFHPMPVLLDSDINDNGQEGQDKTNRTLGKGCQADEKIKEIIKSRRILLIAFIKEKKRGDNKKSQGHVNICPATEPEIFYGCSQHQRGNKTRPRALQSAPD